MKTEKLYRNKDWLNNKYLKEKLSTTKIAKICEVSDETIRCRLKKINISCRSKSESVHLSKANHCDLSIEAISWIYGELLGDGCLQSISPFSAKFQYASKYLEYIQYISDTLKSFGINQSGKIHRQYYKTMDCYTYHYTSLSYVELLFIYKSWYPEGKKIVSRDIVLTPLVCRQWYIGDGYLKHPIYAKPDIRLCTNGFIINDVDWLVKRLNNLGFKSTRQPADNVIYISVNSIKNFLNYIGKCPVSCYQYKFEY